MFKKTKTLVITGMLISMLSTTVLSAELRDSSTKVLPDGRVVEYYIDYADKVYTNMPSITRTLIPGVGGSTARYDINQLGFKNNVPYMVNTGAYMTVSNVSRESKYNNERIVYAKGSTSITFSTDDYLQCKSIMKSTEAINLIENGKVIYSKDHDTLVFEQTNSDNRTIKVYENGLYYVRLSDGDWNELGMYVYVAQEGEDITYVAPKVATATLESLQVKVNAKSYKVPAYKINGDNYLRLRDMGYMLNGTTKQFNVIRNPHDGSIVISTEDKYVAVGGEMKAIATGTKQAKPSSLVLTLDGIQVCPSVYTIDGIDYIKVNHLAGIDNFGAITVENIITINTAVGYKKPATIVKVPVITGKVKADSVERLSGLTRYETAVAISKSGWEQSDNVILASGENYPDALVGSSLAYLKNAPVLITPSGKLDSSISTEMDRLKVKTVYILGNEASVSQNVENELRQKYTVVRIGGTNLYDTAIKVGDEVRKAKQFDTVIVAAQGDYADALAVAPFSARDTMPMIYTDRDSISYDIVKKLQEWGVKNVIIVGGTGVVSEHVESMLNIYKLNVARLQGADRYDTAIEVIKHFAPSDGYKNISIATGESYPDAVTGAVLAAKNNTPLFLVSKYGLKANSVDYLNTATISKMYIFGGTGAVSDGIVTNK